ncbi:MAG TPA: toll/interleukin-1 receptor domain-containing protein [Sphingomonadaceae bacterium]|nr:toll/interleukin-1 receptor domain-containing protein [Sphingomonadaceae bacterium]
MSDIYLACATGDRTRILPIVEALRAAGYSLWWDGDAPARAEQAASARLCLVCWSEASVDSVTGKTVIDEAEKANARGAYLGVLLDSVEPPFGFGGHEAIDVAPFRGAPAALSAIIAGVAKFMAEGQAITAPLPPPPEIKPPSKAPRYIALVAILVALVGLVAFFVIRANAPTTRDLVEAKLSRVPCSWLRVDPVEDGSKGPLALIGVSGNPAEAGRITSALIKAEDLKAGPVSVAKVAQIDPRECAAIDEPMRLRKGIGGDRLTVSGEPFILDTSLTKPQALARVRIALKDSDKSMALFGVEPSGVVTWILPDKTSMDGLKSLDVGYTRPEPGHYEFNVYPDHTGWTGLFLIVGDRPLAVQEPQGTVQRSAEFARTLRAATAEGAWDADMVWFRIDRRQD